MKIKELYTKASAWTKEVSARTTTGQPTHPWNIEAVSFCLSGAIMKCYDINSYPQYKIISDKTLELGYRSPAEFNDNCGYDEVLKLVTELDI